MLILFIDFDEEEEIVELECNHCFNEDAIKKWLKEEKAECPVCRYQLKDTKDAHYYRIMTQIKNTFDPKNLLNPNRIIK